MTLHDLILAAGGTKDSAYLLDSEITRVGINEDQKAFVEHIRIGQDILADSQTNLKTILLNRMILSPLSRYLYGEKEKVLKLLGEVAFPLGVFTP